jgi:transposase
LTSETDDSQRTDAIFYVLRGGVAWRLLPNDLPPRTTVLQVVHGLKQAGVPPPREERFDNALRTIAKHKPQAELKMGKKPKSSKGV